MIFVIFFEVHNLPPIFDHVPTQTPRSHPMQNKPSPSQRYSSVSSPASPYQYQWQSEDMQYVNWT